MKVVKQTLIKVQQVKKTEVEEERKFESDCITKHGSHLRILQSFSFAGGEAAEHRPFQSSVKRSGGGLGQGDLGQGGLGQGGLGQGGLGQGGLGWLGAGWLGTGWFGTGWFGTGCHGLGQA
eukprot:765425-Hanusia_phi.AAC.1